MEIKTLLPKVLTELNATKGIIEILQKETVGVVDSTDKEVCGQRRYSNPTNLVSYRSFENTYVT
jgi:hypothetical protein